MFIFADGTSEFVIAYRVCISPDQRAIICGCCAGENEKHDPMRMTGIYPCDRCGKKKGRQECRDHFCD